MMHGNHFLKIFDALAVFICFASRIKLKYCSISLTFFNNCSVYYYYCVSTDNEMASRYKFICWTIRLENALSNHFSVSIKSRGQEENAIALCTTNRYPYFCMTFSFFPLSATVYALDIVENHNRNVEIAKFP